MRYSRTRKLLLTLIMSLTIFSMLAVSSYAAEPYGAYDEDFGSGSMDEPRDTYEPYTTDAPDNEPYGPYTITGGSNSIGNGNDSDNEDKSTTEKSDNEITGKSAAGTSGSETSVPKTGDSQNIVLWLSLFLTSGVTILSLIRYLRRETE